jgi:hypothetical protein
MRGNLPLPLANCQLRVTGGSIGRVNRPGASVLQVIENNLRGQFFVENEAC